MDSIKSVGSNEGSGDALSQHVELSALDKFLFVWIFIAMASGVLAGNYLPAIRNVVNALQFEGVSLPIGIGLIWMMYPPLAAVRYKELGKVKSSGRMLPISLILNWIVGPFLMFALAWIFLPDMPAFRDGIILVGLARCIAMVLVWNMLAGGNNEYAAILVAVNAVFQIFFYSAYAFLFISFLPGILGISYAHTVALRVSPLLIAQSVAIYLGVPLAMGFVTRMALTKRRGTGWYENVFLPKIKPTALIGLLFTIIVMFSLEGKEIVSLPVDMLRIAAPLVFYFLLMFISSYLLSWKAGLAYEETVTTSLTAASNNFELAIAVAVSVFGISSGEAFATVIGPLIEVPVMIGLVHLSLRFRHFFFGKLEGMGTAATEAKNMGT
ncbi:MAG: ACR3 family arsenite efflux transporter [Methanomassiliicoccales archaeon]